MFKNKNKHGAIALLIPELNSFCPYIFTSNSAVFDGGGAKIALPPVLGTLAPPLITL